MSERELTLATIDHPRFINGGTWQLVDHPTVRPLQDGAPALGWDGDPRLAVYLHLESKTFVLWRLEANEEYMPVGHFAIGGEITPASINETISRLIEVDSRRGFDPYASVMTAHEQGEKAREQDLSDQVTEFADKLHFGLANSHLPGVWITRPRQVLLPGR